jgi:tetratricopeptide (TPR) repeat protein
MITITFYSYKGGVGRSLALANIATRLSEFGKQVCMLDFDLEAPGLHYKFPNILEDYGRSIDKGIVDYVYEFTNNGVIPDSLRNYSYSWFRFKNSCLTLIPAGNPTTNNYWKKLSSINWHELIFQNENGLALLLELRYKIQKEINPDFLLIDSRTGVSDLSGIALSYLADEVVVFAANNKENLEGAKKIIKSISNPEKMIFNKAPHINFVLCRVPFTTSPEDRNKEQNLRNTVLGDFKGLVDDFTVIHSDRDLEELEEIKIGYDKDESVAQISKDYLELFENLAIKYLDPAEIENFNKIKEAEKFFQRAATEYDPEVKLKWLDKALELNKNTEIYLSKANVYEKKGDWEKVISICNEILGFETINIRPYEIKANALLKLNKVPEAKDVFQIILRKDPERISVKLGLAKIAVVENNLDVALKLLNEILEKRPHDSDAYVVRAKLKRKLNQQEDAREDIYRSLDLKIDNAEAFLVLAMINADLGNNNEFYLNFEKALQLADNSNDVLEVTDPVIKTFVKEERFFRIVERYSNFI